MQRQLEYNLSTLTHNPLLRSEMALSTTDCHIQGSIARCVCVCMCVCVCVCARACVYKTPGCSLRRYTVHIIIPQLCTVAMTSLPLNLVL